MAKIAINFKDNVLEVTKRWKCSGYQFIRSTFGGKTLFLCTTDKLTFIRFLPGECLSGDPKTDSVRVCYSDYGISVKDAKHIFERLFLEDECTRESFNARNTDIGSVVTTTYEKSYSGGGSYDTDDFMEHGVHMGFNGY
jgi:hypothetical protein